MTSGYTFILGNWRDDAATISALREQVLVAELGLAPVAGSAATDTGMFHVLAYDGGGRAIGAAGMRADGKIEYVAVLRPWRGRTVGGALISYLHHIAYVQRIEYLWSIVPDSARRFFERNRFVPAGETDPAGDRGSCRYVRRVSKPGERRIPVH